MPSPICTSAWRRSQTANRGIYKTTDAGATWNKVGPLDTPIHVRVDPKDGNHLYANDGVWGNTQGFFVSKGRRQHLHQAAGLDRDRQRPEHVHRGHLRRRRGSGALPAPARDVPQRVGLDRHEVEHQRRSSRKHRRCGDSWIVHAPQAGWGAGHTINFLYRPDLGIGNPKTWLLGAQGAGFWRTSDAGKTWAKVSDLGIQHGGGTVYYTSDGTLYAMHPAPTRTCAAPTTA